MMKIKEFTRKINDLGFNVDITNGNIEVIGNTPYYGFLAVVSNTVEKVMDVNLFGYRNLDEDMKTKVFELASELARTPIEDRKDEDKYFLKHKYLSGDSLEANYLNYNSNVDEYSLNDDDEFPEYQTKFTLKEIQDMSMKLKSNFSDFKIIKVEE